MSKLDVDRACSARLNDLGTLFELLDECYLQSAEIVSQCLGPLHFETHFSRISQPR